MSHATIRTAVPAECLPRFEIEARQAARLMTLLGHIDGRNRFYTEKLSQAGIRVTDLDLLRDLDRLPFTTKAELITDQNTNPPWGTALSESLARYTRYNQTSSTTGDPLRWLDTTESWQWMLECWKAVYRAARVGPADRIFFPFSFGPFLGFWTAFEAGTQLGAHCIPAGGMTSEARLRLIDVLQPTVVCCTPTYALRLVEVASERGEDLADSSVRVVIVAGEPGGNIPATRRQIEAGWGGRVIDHHGLTEVGPISFECWENSGFVHLNECEYICEVLDPDTGQPVPDGDQGELVVTNLGRLASPLIRYRTRDIVVRVSEPCACGRTLSRLVGGIVSRADDMVCVRGVNIYPTAIEAVVRTVCEVVEYRATVQTAGVLGTLSVEIEVGAADPESVTRLVTSRLRNALGLTVPVIVVEPGTLPRFDMKARRFVVKVVKKDAKDR
jgi:phenylacetate-CoA ligase